jgi:phytoene dehydrogenase-like protein
VQTEKERWDAIVIGSGLGGLVAAAYLCAAGRRTLVLEAHYVAGGNSQVFRRKFQGRQYEFDVGVHYIGECGRGGSITQILNGLGLAERVIFRPLDTDGYSTLHFPDLTFRVPFGWDAYRKRLLETFPGEAEPLGQVVDVMRGVSAEGGRVQRGDVPLERLGELAPSFAAWGLRPITELFAEHRISQRASGVILGEQGCYAVQPSKTAVAMHAGLMNHFLGGAYYPQGGGQVIAARLVEAIRAYGGEVRMRAPVQRVRVENGKIAGVVLEKSGAEIDAPVVVSNADLKRTVQQLVGEEHFAPATVERVRGFRMSIPLFVVYVGLDVDLTELGFKNSNHFIWGSYDIEGIYQRLERGELADDAMAYITTASLKDPESGQIAPRGYTNLQIMTLVPREYAHWNVERGPADGGRYHRDPEYRRPKAELMERLLATAESVVPGLREHVDWKEAATPVTQERFTRSTGGTSYGIELAADQLGPLRPGPVTDVPGLFLAGASTQSGAGIAGVMNGGLATASAVLETELGPIVREGEVLGDRSLLPELTADWDAWRESH